MPSSTEAPDLVRPRAAAVAMPRPHHTPVMSPTTISALIHEFKAFDAAVAQREYPWATRFVMGIPLAPWQREFKWDIAQCQRFVSSIWTGVHLGSYVLTDMDLVSGLDHVEHVHLSNCVIDGQQRLRALELYLTDGFAVPDAAGAPALWSEVGVPDRRRFGHTTFTRGTIRDLDEQALRLTYDRLNFGGTPHEEHERAVAPAPVVAEEEQVADLPRG